MPSCLVHTSPVKKAKNAALSLRLGVESTLIRHEKGRFSKNLFKLDEFENAFFVFQWTEILNKEKSFSKKPLNSEEFENTGFAI